MKFAIKVICLVSLALCLSACLSDNELHHQHSLLTEKNLTQPYLYKLTANFNDWWATFNDAYLNQLIDSALSGSPNLQKAYARFAAAAEESNIQAAKNWPNVAFMGKAERDRFSSHGLVPPPFNGRVFNIGQMGFNFNYEFDFWGKNHEAFLAATNEVAASQSEVAAAKLILTSTVAKSYFSLRENIKVSELSQALFNIKQQRFKILKSRADNGLESEITMKTSQTELDRSKIIVENSAQNVLLVKHQLAALLGKNAMTTDFVIPTADKSSSLLLPDHKLYLHAIVKRPDVSASLARVKAAAHVINVAKTGYYPDINLFALLGSQSIGLNYLLNKASQNNSIGAAITLPIFTAGAVKANLGKRYAEYNVAVDTYNQTIIHALNEIADAFVILRNAKNNWQNAIKSLHAANKVYQLTLATYKRGIIDYSRLLTVKENRLEQQISVARYNSAYLQAHVQLYKVLGGLLIEEKHD